jgi:hypothetical protein
MKKLLVLLVFMLTASVAMYASPAKCLLHHNGKVTLYDAEDIEDAIKATVDGDTLYLSEGQFAGFTITKKITVRGSGQMSRIGGDIVVEIPDSPTLTSALLEGFYSNSNIIIKSVVNGLQIKQCKFKDIQSAANVNNVVLDKCHVSGRICLNQYWLGLTCNNSKISRIETNTYDNTILGYGTVLPSSASIYFINCNIWEIWHGYDGADYISVINSIVKSTITLKESNVSYCLTGTYNSNTLNYDAQATQVYSIYTDNTSYYVIDSNTLECKFDAATLESNGYMGQDNSIVGCYGGTSPFTLDLIGPKVTATAIQIDNDTKQLSVTLNVTAK